MTWLLPFAAGAAAGLLSGLGVGGGSLLLLFLTGYAGMSQQQAQGINLLYFIPSAAAALVSHIKNRCVVPQALLPAILSGGVCTILSAALAVRLDTELLHRCFGAFLLAVGTRELLRKGGA